MRVSGLSFGPLLAVLALAACAGVSADFVKEGATKEQVRADNAACRSETEAQVGRDAKITHDIRTGGNRAQRDSTRLLEQTRDAGAERRYERIFANCMAARGYKRIS